MRGRVHLAVVESRPLRTAVDFGIEMIADEEVCVACGRMLVAHGTPVEIDGEMVTPACERIHPGGVTEDDLATGDIDLARWPICRPPELLRRRARAMLIDQALRIAGSLGQTTKMPGASYGLDARRCITGSKLVDQPGSVCEGCYALKNFYAYWRPAIIARDRRQAGILRPLWPEAMVSLILEYLRKGGEPWFRFHDSGDVQSVEHLARIAGVASALPEVGFWLPTREYAIVAEWLKGGGVVPSNLTIRLSAHWIDQPPHFDDEALLGLPMSTVHSADAPPVAVSERRADVIACRASTRDNQCGKCRACWSPMVRSVSYPLH